MPTSPRGVFVELFQDDQWQCHDDPDVSTLKSFEKSQDLKLSSADGLWSELTYRNAPCGHRGKLPVAINWWQRSSKTPLGIPTPPNCRRPSGDSSGLAGLASAPRLALLYGRHLNACPGSTASQACKLPSLLSLFSSRHEPRSPPAPRRA